MAVSKSCNLVGVRVCFCCPIVYANGLGWKLKTSWWIRMVWWTKMVW